jgi:L,D-peptidoglycan transpeptidase YkuD (ErfK/YbiS/YcfS/YnhG family)
LIAPAPRQARAWPGTGAAWITAAWFALGALIALPGWAREPSRNAPKKAIHSQTATKSARASAPKRQRSAPAAVAAAASRPAGAGQSDQAESRLIRVYRLTAQGRADEALSQAQALARDFPNFQLAQLALGDLLAARVRPLAQFGDAAAPLPEADVALAELRKESHQRVAAERLRPAAGAIPAAFVEISDRTRHAIAVDASRSRLYLFENGKQGLRLVADYYASVGKLGIEKEFEGDQRTPLGVYYITSRLDAKQLADLYGSGALPLNYPNALDLRRGKTGSGIWLHGTPSAQFARAPQATDGCVAIANPDLERILNTVEPRSTPVVIASQLRWVTPQGVAGERQAFNEVLEAWSKAKSEGDLQRLLGFYTYDFQGMRSQSITQWRVTLQEDLEALRGRSLVLKDKSALHWRDSSETMVVTFAEVPQGERSGPVKRQYWRRQGQRWQIFFEGVIG